MITTRLHGSTTLVMISKPPDIQDGFWTCTFCAPKIVRTPWMRMRLKPQVASSVSSGSTVQMPDHRTLENTPTPALIANAIGTATSG